MRKRSSKLRICYKSFALIAFVILSACQTPKEVLVDNNDNEAQRLEELYWSRIESSRQNYTDADVNFMIGMIGHHAQALIMSDLAPKNGASSQIQVLASRIINAQNDEIATMQRWLKNRGLPSPEIHIHGLHLMIHGIEDHDAHHDHSSMPGMLSQEQLEELANSHNAEFDRLFLKYMIDHHNGAVIMVKELFATDGAAQDEEAFRLATDIQVDQITEIERMKLMLQNLDK